MDNAYTAIAYSVHGRRVSDQWAGDGTDQDIMDCADSRHLQGLMWSSPDCIHVKRTDGEYRLFYHHAELWGVDVG